MIDSTTRHQLLGLARASLEARVRRERPPVVPAGLQLGAFGVFVSIHRSGDLRGCLGLLDCGEPLAEAVVRLAAAVSHEDHRFAPLMPPELSEVTIDLSVLTAPEPVADHTAIEVGRHGLIVEHGHRKGLLLPQVASQNGWDRKTFLVHTCLKAGLPADALLYGAAVFRFEAEVFGEAFEAR